MLDLADHIDKFYCITSNRGCMPTAAAAAKSLQSCPTLCDHIDGSPTGSSVHGILQARTLEWVAISSSNEWQWKVNVKSLSHVRLLATPWTAAHQAPPSMGFSRQEYWSGVPLPSLKYFSSMKIFHIYQIFSLCFIYSFMRAIFWNANRTMCLPCSELFSSSPLVFPKVAQW